VSARPVAAIALLCLLACAAPAAAVVAPGRVTFPIGPTATHDGVDALGLSDGVALPGGGVVLAGIDRSHRIVLAQLHADGSLDPAFGTGGIAHVGAPSFVAQFLQVLRPPDGRLLIVAALPPAGKYELARMVVVALSAGGALDPTFGDGGVATPGVQWGCANCSPAALAPDGSIVLTGSTGQVPPAIEHDPSVVPDFHWVAARLTPTGGLDAGFGQQGIAALPGTNAMGYATASVPGGTVAVLGRDVNGPKLARLTVAGALDPAFAGGAPVALSGAFPWWFGLRGRADGSVDALGSAPGSAQLVRYTASGGLDPAFGTVGVVSLTAGNGPATLLAAPDGADVVAGPASIGNPLETPQLGAARVSAAGVVASVANVAIPFGGGQATAFAVHRAPFVTSLQQNGFFPGRPVARADGSLVLPGAIAVVQYTGEGAGYGIDQAAVAAVTPAFALDPSFGGPARLATVSVHVARQRATSAADVRLLRVAVSARTSGPGLCRLRVNVGRRVIAHSTAPVFAAGPQRLRALLTTVGRRYLRHAHRVPVTVTATFRDLVGAQATARATGTLR
jgi:uncharacterized delta-60 repeat protein